MHTHSLAPNPHTYSQELQFCWVQCPQAGKVASCHCPDLLMALCGGRGHLIDAQALGMGTVLDDQEEQLPPPHLSVFPSQLQVHMALQLCPVLGDHTYAPRVGTVLGQRFLWPAKTTKLQRQVGLQAHMPALYLGNWGNRLGLWGHPCLCGAVTSSGFLLSVSSRSGELTSDRP